MIDPNFVIKTEVDKPGYGMFVMEPLEQGYGHTLGNSLRRVLLTSLPGSSITSIKIGGVSHQFSTLAGLKEDIVELILNLKKVRLAVATGEAAVLKLSKKGVGPVTAGDFEVPAGVTIVNPDMVIANLTDKKAELDLEANVETGYGYVQADERKVDEVGRIPMDSLFSPVVRVNYRVDATRVGRMTNLDKLVMEIWTDETITPFAALKSAAKVLVSYFLQVYEPKARVSDETIAVTPSVSDEVLKMRIEELDIPTRIVNALARGSIETIGQLLGTPRVELMKIKNLGAKSLSIVEDKLREKGVAISV
ncbi:DNA-directed RNA polymerase subunit alpha [Candidatus Gottesmanbacteria bacterium]|nr:DNA-directed RNA polymerase subunit alpha [Candidatus Gottesmanbacteria bacterium]